MSPESFKEMQAGKSLEELYEIRREIMEDLIDFEDNYDGKFEFFPSPETRYIVNNLYLIKVCELISEKLASLEE